MEELRGAAKVGDEFGLNCGITCWYSHQILIDPRLIPGEGRNRMGWFILTQETPILISIVRIDWLPGV
jgi:hypothetical protein